MAALSAEAKLYKEDAIALRKQGLSYREILVTIPVAKSTLALWLQSVGLSQKQKQRLTAKKIAGAFRGGQARKTNRIWETHQIMEAAKSEVGALNWRELWLMGVMLYWAEGSKEKEYRPGARVQFTNTDPRMIKLFLHWLNVICGIGNENVSLEIYIHETSRYRTKEIIDYWSRETGFPVRHFTRIYFKKENQNTNRKNIGETYFGVLTVRVRNSSSLSRKIAGWVEGVVESSH